MDISQLERDSQIRTTALVILTFIAAAVALYFLRPVLLPFVLALFIASGLAPVLNAVQRRLDSTRPMAIFVTALLSVTVTVVLWLVIWISVSGLLNSSGSYSAGFDKMLDRVSIAMQRFYPESVQPEKPNTPEPATEIDVGDDEPLAPFASAASAAKQEGEDRLAPFRYFFNERMESIIRNVANELFAVFSSGLLVMIFLFFLLLGGSHVTLPENNIWREVDAHVRKYIVLKSMISAVTGFVFGLVLWLFGVPLAFVLGILAFLLNFIPNLGPIIASLLPVPLVWLLVEATRANDAALAAGAESVGVNEPHMGMVKAIVVIALAAGVQFTSGNVVEPKLMGDQFRLHPIAILLSLMFWYMIWGLVGAFLAVPITSALKIMLGELESTRPAADLLEGNLSILAKREVSTPATGSA